MKYEIKTNNNDLKLSYHNVKITGLSVTPKNENKGFIYNASKVTIIDNELSTTYIKKRINKKINKIVAFMLRIMNDEDTTEGDASLVLDEIARLKGVILNKYKEHLNISEYKALISKIIIVEEEFKKQYNRKMYIRDYIARNMFNYNEEFTEGKSR